MIPRCPDCGALRGGRYQHGQVQVCWSCWQARTGLGPLPPDLPTVDPDWVIFRKRIIDALWAVDSRRFVYVDEDTIGGACPVCITGHVRVYFHGRAARADISCSLGCVELDIAHALGRATRCR
jgi:hypothetical protein